MSHLNVEFKARTARPDEVLSRLQQLGARLQGVDTQIDIYYRVPRGRLKLRQGQIENSLICYHRPDDAGPKSSRVHLAPLPIDCDVAEVLDAALTRDVVVSKERRILWLENVKFHVDTVADLGTFLEVEAIDRDGSLGLEHLQVQCDRYRRLLGVREEDFEARSYSDLVRDVVQTTGT